ncbi:MAG: hypothetical protein KF773_28330 [Deltaproteobacteria bacterium]|nr:hypothetical protein [Deltaproteobacteria bacterium]MCW5804477.1 hypothetical protein [Deltaproteobacteria bacterium]
MSKNLNQIERRHGRDSWKDALFIGLALLLTALSIGAVTSKATGKPIETKWEVTVKEGVPTVQR